MILPPHSSHYTQPLDLALFSPLKAAMAVEIDKTIRTGIMRVLKVEWLTVYINARATAFSMQNILAGWFAAGLSPFTPAKVLDRFTDLTPTEGNNRPQTPNTSPLFPDTILNSSPSDAISMHQHNNALIGLINSNQPLSTPAKRYVNQLTKSAERLFARATIRPRKGYFFKLVASGEFLKVNTS